MAGKWFDRFFLSFGVAFAAVQFYTAGLDAHKHFWNATFIDLMLAIFWVVVVGFILESQMQRRLRENNEKHLKKMTELLHTIDKVEAGRRKQQALRSAVESVIAEVTKGKPAKASDAPKIEKAFHNRVKDHWARVKFNKAGGFDIEILDQPPKKKGKK